MEELHSRGFKMKPDPLKTKIQSPLVSAHGTVALFEKTFKVILEKHIRRGDKSIPSRLTEWFETASGADPVASEVPGALKIGLPRPPTLLIPSLPIGVRGSTNLRMPGDIAQLTCASRVHREVLPTKAQATGGGVRVAVIDSGFYPHPYFSGHGYRITRIPTPGGDDPDVDDSPHGTAVVSNVFACAPDVDLYGIKIGSNPIDAWTAAMNVFADVISTSIGDPIKNSALSPAQVALQTQILITISAGTTVVAAAGDGPGEFFPAMMPEVIAVGGVEVSHKEAVCVWPGSSSFTSSTALGTRDVPDLCAVAAEIDLPSPSDDSASGDPGTWSPEVGTSLAAPQIAGICALMLQKNPALTPFAIKNRLIENAKDVKCGTSASGDKAQKSVKDRATGNGFVDAYAAWSVV
jgi:subtilisin family serine protease